LNYASTKIQPAMSAHAYTEDQLFERPAIGLFAELGWQIASALERSNSALPGRLRFEFGFVKL